MSLNWDVHSVRDWREVVDGEEYLITDALALTTIAVGIGNITRRNWNDFFERLDTIQREDYALFKRDGQNFYFTKDHVERRIGLRTNGDTISRRDWDKARRQRILARALAEAKRRRDQSYQPN